MNPSSMKKCCWSDARAKVAIIGLTFVLDAGAPFLPPPHLDQDAEAPAPDGAQADVLNESLLTAASSEKKPGEVTAAVESYVRLPDSAQA